MNSMTMVFVAAMCVCGGVVVGAVAFLLYVAAQSWKTMK